MDCSFIISRRLNTQKLKLTILDADLSNKHDNVHILCGRSYKNSRFIVHTGNIGFDAFIYYFTVLGLNLDACAY